MEMMSKIEKKANVKRVRTNTLKTPEEEVQLEGKHVKRIALKTPEEEVQSEEITKNPVRNILPISGIP